MYCIQIVCMLLQWFRLNKTARMCAATTSGHTPMDIYDASSAGIGPSSSPARLSYVSEKHPRHTLEAVNVLRKHRELCDVVLIVGQRRIFGHRVVLSACSPYFHAMFTGELVESRQMEVTEQLCAQFELALASRCIQNSLRNTVLLKNI